MLTLRRADYPDEKLPDLFQLTLAEGTTFKAQLEPASLEKAKAIEDLRFLASLTIQGSPLKGIISYKGLDIAAIHKIPLTEEHETLWVHEKKDAKGKRSLFLPGNEEIGEGVVLPKSFRDAGILLGDRGTLSYVSPTASVIEEQHIPIFVAGFYDPGYYPHRREIYFSQSRCDLPDKGFSSARRSWGLDKWNQCAL